MNINNQKSIYVEEYDKVLVKVEEKIKEEENERKIKGENGTVKFESND